MGGENKLTFWQRVKGAFGPIDLTKGGMTKGIILFALPIILSYLFQQIYTISDAAICGQTLSSGRVAGINDSTSLIYIFLQFAFGSTAGFCVVTSLRIGAVQGMGKSAFVLGAGVGELVARVLICLFLPSAISGGAVDASSGSAAFFALCTADPLAWFAADAVLAFSFIPHVARCGKGGRRRKNMLSAA